MLRPLWKPALFVCLCFLYLHGLASVGLLGPDEPRYAYIGREMAKSGDWVTPRLWGEPWFEKPALTYWLIGAAYSAGFGDNWAPRVGVAVLSLLFLTFFYFQLRREFGDDAAFYATIVLCTSAGWFAFSQVGVTDLPMSAAFAASMLLALRWVRSGGRRGLLLAGVLLGLAVLAKGLVPLVLAAPLVWVGRKRWRDLWAMAVGCLAAAVPWYWTVYARNGWPFVQEFFVEHHFGRFAHEGLQHVQPFWFYVPVILAGMFPWSPALALLFRRSGFTHPARQLLLLVLAFGFVFFSASTNKLPGYILPLLPMAAALIGIQLAESSSGRWVAPASALLLGTAPIIGAILPTALDRGLSRAALPFGSYALGLVPAIAVAGLTWYFERVHKRTYSLVLAGIAAAAAILYLQAATYPALERVVSTRQQFRERTPQCVDAHARRQVQYGLHFYAARPLPVCSQ